MARCLHFLAELSWNMGTATLGWGWFDGKSHPRGTRPRHRLLFVVARLPGNGIIGRVDFLCALEDELESSWALGSFISPLSLKRELSLLSSFLLNQNHK